MRLTAAFFANRAEIVSDMLNLEGAFWKTITVEPDAAAFSCSIVVVCDVDEHDMGQQYEMRIDAEGPSGQRWSPAQSTVFTVEAQMMFMCVPKILLPLEPGGGFHMYTFRLDGQHERLDVPLAVRVANPSN